MLSPMKAHHLLAFAVFALCPALSLAQIKIEGAWARPTVKGQQGGGGYMAVTSATGDRLLGGSTTLSQRFELHTMSMKGDVMEMRQMEAVDLPAGKKIEFKPGGMHLMFSGLKQPLALGSKVPVTRKFDKSGDVKVEFEIMSHPAAPMHKH